MKFNEQKVKAAIEACTTKKQVMQVLKTNHITIYRDDSKEVGNGKGFSIWLDEHTRIYKPLHGNMRYQKWERVTYQMSGVPAYPEAEMSWRKGIADGRYKAV